MADRFTTVERSRIMSRVRSKNTKPELLTRSILHRCGLRFRLHQTGLPGTPDIVLRKYKAVVFVHGCFWHRHRGCKRSKTPKSNQNYWDIKFKKNVERFKKQRVLLEKLGWRVFVLWECETKNPDNIIELARKLKAEKPQTQ